MQSSGVLSGEVLRPRTMGDPMATEISQTLAIVHLTRLLLLYVAYLIGRHTAMNLCVVGEDGVNQGPKNRQIHIYEVMRVTEARIGDAA